MKSYLKRFLIAGFALFLLAACKVSVDADISSEPEEPFIPGKTGLVNCYISLKDGKDIKSKS